MPSTTRRGRRDGRTPARTGLLGATAVVSAAFLGTNVLAYVFTVLAARLLAPAAYGELAALLSVLLVGSVAGTGMQTRAALQLGGRPGDGRTTGRLHAATTALGLGVCLLALLLVPAITALLHLPSAATAVWLALLLLPQTMFHGYQGLLQGSARHRRLAVVTVGFSSAKFGGGVLGLLLGDDAAAALAGMALGSVLGALVGWLANDRPGLARGLRVPAGAALGAAGALLGLVVLVNLDVILARHHLAAVRSGEYAVAAIFTKIAFWLPQGVGVVLLPRLADAAGRRRALLTALAAVAGVGGALVLATAALGSAALPLIVGPAYAGTAGGATWLFAALGTLLALAQLLLFSGIAAGDRLSTVAVWSAAAVEVLAVEVLAATGRLTLVSLAATAALTAGALVATGLLRLRRADGMPVGADGTVPATAP